MFSGIERDEFGKEYVPPLPLTFDRVNGYQPFASSCLLFQLPQEILMEILQHIPGASLATLALVNRDCRQLARSRQFASIHLDYSPAHSQLLVHLLRNISSPTPSAKPPSTGPCVRRLFIATHPEFLGIGVRQLRDLPTEETSRRMNNASKTYCDVYLKSIELILPQVPNLELLDWEDKITIPRTMFTAFACSSIQHLKLYRVSVDEEFELSLPPELASQGWPLLTLYLDLSWNIMDREKGEESSSPLCSSILQSCAKTLRSLNWVRVPVHHGDAEKQSLISREGLLPSFSHLQELTLAYIAFADSASLMSLIDPSRLRALNIHTGLDPVCTHFFTTCGTINSLETLVEDTYRVAADHKLAFLGVNPQISKLCLQSSISTPLMEMQFLPLLTQSFSKLRSLSLVWDDTQISNYALRQVGQLSTLEQLQLSAGEQFGWKHNWPIDHKPIRKHLSKLVALKRLAISRDSYVPGRPGATPANQPTPDNVQHYYEERIIIPRNRREGSLDTSDGGEHSDDYFERIHRKRMMAEAKGYTKEFPGLEWLYLGQIPVGITKSSAGRQVSPLSEARDSCWTLLRQMFGFGDDA